jgi:integrase
VRSWLSTGLARGDWRETTARHYAESLDLHVLPSLGHLFIDELTPRVIERALGEWAVDHARSTVNSWLRVLRAVLNDAVAHGLITSNPAERVRALRERADDEGDEDDWANALSPDELDAYLRGWRDLYPEHLPLITTLVLTGLRWGEATALIWADIENAEHAWVFANGAGNPYDNGALFAKNRSVLKHAGVTKHVTIHGLRRTATDLLRRAAVDPVTAKAIIGHTTDRMREHYSTVGRDEARGIGARLVSLVPAVSGSRDGSS